MNENQEAFDPAAKQLDSEFRGFWSDAWKRFRQRKLPLLALAFVFALALIALLSPAIVGTKPIMCRYKGTTYFPALGYFHESWENPIFITTRSLTTIRKN